MSFLPDGLNFAFLIQRKKKTRHTSECSRHVGVVVPEARVGAALPIADVHRRVVVDADEVDGPTDQLRLLFGEGRNPRPGLLLHDLRVVSFHQGVQDPEQEGQKTCH